MALSMLAAFLEDLVWQVSSIRISGSCIFGSCCSCHWLFSWLEKQPFEVVGESNSPCVTWFPDVSCSSCWHTKVEVNSGAPFRGVDSLVRVDCNRYNMSKLITNLHVMYCKTLFGLWCWSGFDRNFCWRSISMYIHGATAEWRHRWQLHMVLFDSLWMCEWCCFLVFGDSYSRRIAHAFS